jgi:endo-1,4-beta-mannosidase
MYAEAGQPFVFGVNYWPRRKAMYWWSDFDAQEAAEEFDVLKELGLTLVRIFLLWDDFQPTPDAVSADALASLATVADLAAERGLKLDVTFFTGHMSGPNWSPRWLLDDAQPHFPPRKLVSAGEPVVTGYRNFFTDPVAWAAQLLQIETVVRLLRDHPGVGMWNLGNEPDLFAIAPDRETGRRWVSEMCAAIRALDTAHPITCGLHAASLMSRDALRIDDTFGITDLAVMHSYPMYSHVSRSPLDPLFVPFTCALTSALCGKPTLMEEFGGCTADPGGPSELWAWNAYGVDRSQFMASESALADYLAQVLPALVDVGATGSLTWCFADYHESLWSKPPCDEARHERFFGLVRPDGTLKEHALVIKRFAETNPVIRPARYPVTLDLSPDDFYADPAGHAERLYRQWLIARGEPLTLPALL